MSTQQTFSTLYPLARRISKSLARLVGLQDMYIIYLHLMDVIIFTSILIRWNIKKIV